MDKAIEQIMAAITDRIIHHEEMSKNYDLSKEFRHNEVFISMGLREAMECCYEVQRQLRAEDTNSGSQTDNMSDPNMPYPEGVCWDEAWRQRQRADKLQAAIDEIETERERLEQMYAEFPGSMDHYAAETILDALDGLKK